jgi:2-polyprenyl-3-methyl-5-hydroxy-6-metoxy-1,4-benzoquinol methylase
MNVPQDDLINECFHCNGKDYKTSRWMTYGTINLIKCKQCDLIHLYPIAHHTSGYEDLAQEETVRQIGLLNEKDTTSYNHGNGILDLIETHTGKKEGSLLDIGCKFGDLLIAADRRGWNTIGIELNADFCAIARDSGLEVYNDVIERLDIDISGFDIIILSHVLEHIERPDSSLKAIFDRLNPMGILYVETPNQSSPIAWGVYRGRWLGVATPGHIWAFTHQTLKKVVQSTGFEIIWQNRWIPYSTNDYPKTIKGQIRRYLFSFFNWLGQGDIVGIIAQKP